MKAKLKKILAFFMAAVMAAMVLCVPAGAESFDKAVSISSGKKVKTTLNDRYDFLDYKIKVSKSGTLEIKYTAGMNCNYLSVFDEDGAPLKIKSAEVKVGGLWKGGKGETQICSFWDETMQMITATVTYTVSKGTYYIKVVRDQYYFNVRGDGSLSLTAKFPSESASSSSSSSSSSGACMAVVLGVGDKLYLDASDISGSVTWTSSKNAVAKVNSKGMVTAKSEGTATITAKGKNSSLKIKIIVE